MKFADIKPGMVVAEKAPSYSPLSAPTPKIVLGAGSEYRRRPILSGSQQGSLAEVGFTDPATGQKIVVSLPKSVWRKFDPERDRNDRVMVAWRDRGDQWRVTELTTAQIEGEFEEVAARRAEQRRRREIAEEARKTNAKDTTRRVLEASEVLRGAGLVKEFVGSGTGMVSLDIADYERLAAFVREHT